MRFVLILPIILIPILFSGCIQPQKAPQVPEQLATEKWVADGVINKGEYDRNITLFGPKTSGYPGGNLDIYWKNDAEFLYMGLKGNTTGWMAIGFEPDEWMKNADIIIGWVDHGKPTVLDEFSTDNYGPHVLDTELGGTNDILEFGGKQENGQTTIEFKRKLNTGDKFDKVLVPGQNVSIIWAMADTTSEQQKHNLANGEGIIELEDGRGKTLSMATLSTNEKQGILLIREEEKVARDLYLSLYSKDKLSIFPDVAQSEQRHMDSVKVLINEFGLHDPLQEGMGNFTNQSLKGFYDDSLAKGTNSPEDALRAGALFEEMSISDLQRELSHTSNRDITSVYDGLLSGSRKHLRSYVNALKDRGISYYPQHLGKKEFDEDMRYK